jgi:two-component system, sensor histidine kinase
MSVTLPFCESILPVGPDAGRAQVLDRFLTEPGLELLPVTRNNRPVGLITRGRFALGLLQDGALSGSIQAMTVADPVIINAALGLDDICDRMRSSGDAAPGVIMVDAEGGYIGVISATALLLALQQSAQLERGVQAPKTAQLSTIPSSSARDRELFISAVAHQIDGPLEGIISLSERLSRHPLNSDGRTQVQTILETGRGVLQLVRHAAALGRIDAGDIVLAPEPVILGDLMVELEEAWRVRAEAAGLTLMVSYEGPQDLTVSVDPEMMRRLFNTLVERALSVTPRGIVEASLKAKAEATGVYLEGRIRDGGISLAANRLARIFEPMPDRSGGSFLESVGLALCNRIIGVMHGNIRAESNVGAGASIAFDLLVPELAFRPQSAQSLNAAADNVVRAHVLVVDDNATNRMVAEALCEMFGCTSEAVEDGVEAVEYAATGRFDVALMDIKMPRMDGVEATLAIRALPGAARNLPIIALTANADPEDVRRYLSIGMCDVVDKPIKSDILRDAIRAALASTTSGAQADASAVA